MLKVMAASSDQGIPENGVENEEQRGGSIHPLFGALLILGGRALSMWLLLSPDLYLGYAYAVAYIVFGEFGAVSMSVVILGGIVLAIFGINRGLKRVTGSGLFFF